MLINYGGCCPSRLPGCCAGSDTADACECFVKEFALQWLVLAWLRGIFAHCILCMVALWHLGNSQESNCFLKEPVGDLGWLIWHLVSQSDHRTRLLCPLNPHSHQNLKAPPSPRALVVFGNLFTDVITSFANFPEDCRSELTKHLITIIRMWKLCPSAVVCKWRSREVIVCVCTTASPASWLTS